MDCEPSSKKQKSLYGMVLKEMKNPMVWTQGNMIYGAVRCMQGYLSEHERIVQILPKDDTLVVTTTKRSFVVDHPGLGWNKTQSPDKPAQVVNILDLHKFEEAFDEEEMQRIADLCARRTLAAFQAELRDNESITDVTHVGGMLESFPGILEVKAQVVDQVTNTTRVVKIYHPIRSFGYN